MGEGYLLKRLKFAVNLQAHPSGLRAFPELDGSFWCLPSGNPTSTTLPLAEEAVPQNSELRPKNVRLLHRLPYRRAGPVWAYGCLARVSSWNLGALLRGVVSFVPLLALNSPLFVELK